MVRESAKEDRVMDRVSKFTAGILHGHGVEWDSLTQPGPREEKFRRARKLVKVYWWQVFYHSAVSRVFNFKSESTWLSSAAHVRCSFWVSLPIAGVARPLILC
jgi:hypothetical protein